MKDSGEKSWIVTGEDEGGAAWKTRESGAFPQTRWSLVVEAGQDNTLAAGALEELCRSYWYPLYSFARRQGKASHDAQDLVQGFFEYLLGGNYLARADRERGKLRSYLLGALKHYSAHQYRKATALKRGGGQQVISIDEELAEERFRYEPRADESENPDRLFDRRWALTVLEGVLARLGREFKDAGKEEQFRILSGFLAWNSGTGTYAEAGSRLGMKEGAVKVAVHRMRKRYRDLLYDEVLATVNSPEEVEDEINHLVEALQ